MFLKKPDILMCEFFNKNHKEILSIKRPIDYIDKYLEYLCSTNEKMIISDQINVHLIEGSILDIGAGTGDIVEKIDLKKYDYTCVEHRPEFVKILKSRGLSVIEGIFPCKCQKTYTNVILSYVLGNIKHCEILINSAWQQLDQYGQLIIVTYRDSMDDFNRLLQRVGYEGRKTYDMRYNYLISELNKLGKTNIINFKSKIIANTIASLVRSIGFLATNTQDGSPAKRNQIIDTLSKEIDYINKYYLIRDNLYEFPIEHYIFITTKNESTI